MTLREKLFNYLTTALMFAIAHFSLSDLLTLIGITYGALNTYYLIRNNRIGIKNRDMFRNNKGTWPKAK